MAKQKAEKLVMVTVRLPESLARTLKSGAALAGQSLQEVATVALGQVKACAKCKKMMGPVHSKCRCCTNCCKCPGAK